MKTCTKCGETKPLDFFGRDCSKQDGRRPQCKTCLSSYERSRREAVRAYRSENRDVILRQRKEQWQRARQLGTATWLKKNSQYVAEHRRNNAERLRPIVAENSRRRYARKRNASPLWADPTVIALFYTTRQYLSQDTGEQWHVDHVVPLQGRNVCGLHVHFNLCVVPAEMNLAKGNRFPIT